MNVNLIEQELEQIELQLFELAGMMKESSGLENAAQHKVFSSLCVRKHFLQVERGKL